MDNNTIVCLEAYILKIIKPAFNYVIYQSFGTLSDDFYHLNLATSIWLKSLYQYGEPSICI